MFLDIFIKGKPTLVGFARDVMRLVGIGAGYVTISGSFWIALIATCSSYFFVNVLKDRIGVDDALDAFGCHGVSGIIGSIATGLFATKSVNSSLSANGLFYGGGVHLFLIQLAATAITIVFVTVMCIVLIKALQLVMPMRVDSDEEPWLYIMNMAKKRIIPLASVLTLLKHK